MRIAVGLGVLATAVVTFLLVRPGELEPFRLGRLGFAVVLAVPAALAVTSLVRRGVLLIPAALLSIVMSWLLWSGMPLLFIPGVGYIWAYAYAPEPSPLGARAAAAVLAPVGPTLGAVLVLLTGNHTERCVSNANETMCSTSFASDSAGRFLLAMALAFLAVLSGALLARPVVHGGVRR